MTRRWTEVNSLSNGKYSVNKNIRFKTSMQKSDLRDYSNAYIVVKGRLTFGTDDSNKKKIKS